MKRLFQLTLVSALLLLCGSVLWANAEDLSPQIQALIPDQASITSDQRVGNIRVLTMELTSGETLDLTIDLSNGAPLSLVSRVPVSVDSPQAQGREEAEALVLSTYPDAWILFAEDIEGGAKRLGLLSESLCGQVTVQSGMLVSRDLRFDHFAQDGYLTIDGALAAMRLLRPEAEYYALERDSNDGYVVYEGNARIDGVEYEFELDAQNVQLLEWERD